MIPVPQSVLESLAECYGTDARRMAHYAGGREESDGVVYAYPYGDGRRLLKILVISEEDQRRGVFCLEERLRFARFMGENGAHIVFPQLSPQGNLYETTLGESKIWVGYSMDIAPGSSFPPTAWDPAFFRNWGQTVGRLHRLAQQYPSWKSSVDPASGEIALTWLEEWEVFYQWIPDDEVKPKWLEIRRELEGLPVTREVFGFVHNDPHIWNLLVDGDRITLLDFDVANHHWFVSDIAIACQSVLSFQCGGMSGEVYDQEKLRQFLHLFLEGYEREHRLPAEWLDRLDLFIAYRRILLFTVMHGWIQSQPGVHKSWKAMILSRPEVAGALSEVRPGA